MIKIFLQKAVYASDGTLKGVKTSNVITDDKMETAELALSETDTAKAML